jgi:uncharacterized damage-inducible protein DinB
MTPFSIVATSVENAGKTLSKVLQGFPAEAVTQRAHSSMFSTHEAMSHLTECYVAFESHIKGEEHQWGSFTSSTTQFDEAVEELFQTRSRVVQLLNEESDEAALTSALDYLVSHDWYHIGQLATNRQAFEPYWNSYALYS